MQRDLSLPTRRRTQVALSLFLRHLQSWQQTRQHLITRAPACCWTAAHAGTMLASAALVRFFMSFKVKHSHVSFIKPYLMARLLDPLARAQAQVAATAEALCSRVNKCKMLMQSSGSLRGSTFEKVALYRPALSSQAFVADSSLLLNSLLLLNFAACLWVAPMPLLAWQWDAEACTASCAIASELLSYDEWKVPADLLNICRCDTPTSGELFHILMNLAGRWAGGMASSHIVHRSLSCNGAASKSVASL